MKKEETIKRYGGKTYTKQLEASAKYGKEWKRTHPALVTANSWERNRKDGKHYGKTRLYEMNGLRHTRGLIRKKHQYGWTPFKQIIAPDSQLHHEWIQNTCEYRGVALVEKDQHQHGYIDVIQILEGEITLLTEAEIRGGK